MFAKLIISSCNNPLHAIYVSSVLMELVCLLNNGNSNAMYNNNSNLLGISRLYFITDNCTKVMPKSM